MSSPEEGPGRQTLGRGALAAAAGTALSRVTGYVRLAALVYAVGVAENRLADTYTLANTTPNILYELVLGGALSAIVLRVFIEVRSERGREEAWLFLTRLTNVAVLLLGSIALIGVIASPLIMRAYTLRAPDSVRPIQQQVGTLFLMMFVPQILFYGLNTIATAVLRAERKFGVLSVAPVLNNLTVTATFVGFAVVFDRTQRTLEGISPGGIALLGIGTTSGVALLGLVPWIYSRRFGRRRVPGAGLRDPRLGRVMRLYAYTLGYVATNQAGLWYTLILANQVTGAVIARDAAFTLYQLPHGLMAVSISIVAGTALTERAVSQDMAGFASALSRGLRAISFVILPAVAGYLAIGPDIVRLLLEHGIAGPESTSLISALLRAYAVGLLFFSWWHLILTSFQGLGDTRTPMLINIGAFAVQVTVMTSLFFTLNDPVDRVFALGLGHAASYAVATVVALRILHRTTGISVVRDLMPTVVKSAAASLAVAGTSYVLAGRFGELIDTTTLANQLAQILLSVGGGLLMYVAISKLLRTEELGWIRGLLARR